MMKKHKSHNPIYLVLCLFMPWRFFNTFYILEEGRLTLSRYYSQPSGKFKRRVDTVELDQLVEYGFPGDVGTKPMEATVEGASELGGSYTYVSQEVHFVTRDRKVISWNVRPYSKKQCRRLSEQIYNRCEIAPGKRFKQIIG